MTCQMNALLADYLDNELSPPEAQRVEAHVAACSACRGELGDLKAVSRALSSLPQRPLPGGFLQRLDHKRQQAGTEPRQPLLSPPARVAAFAFAAALLILFVLPRIPSLRSDAAPTIAATTSPQDSGDDLKPSRKLAHAAGEPIFSNAQTAPAVAAARGTALAQPVGAAQAEQEEQAAAEQSAQASADAQVQFEREKRRMGIRQIILPQDDGDGVRHPMGQLSDYGDQSAGAGAGPETLAMSASPATVGGTTPGILGSRSLLGAAVPRPAETAPAAGFVLGSQAEQAELWRRRGLTAAPPAVDYSSQRLVVVVAEDLLGSVEIDDVRALPDRVVVSYRVGDLPEGTAQPASPSFQYRILAQSALPVSFERLP